MKAGMRAAIADGAYDKVAGTADPFYPKDPDYYTGKNGMRSRDVCREFDLGRWEAQAFGYIIRHRKKGGAQDIQKAINILGFLLEDLEAEGKAAK